MRSSISFVLDHRRITLDFRDGTSPTTTVLQYLRNLPNHKGAKEGCAEGDCGACTVALGELMPDGRVRYRTIDSCLVFLPMIDGKQLITVENLSQPAGTLHPVQAAMVETNGSQCGYCTPGIVMSLFGLYENADSPARSQVVDTLSGNLCRCTGYRPIVDAAFSACARRETEQYPSDEKQLADTLRGIPKESILIQTPRQTYFRPCSLREALELRSRHPDAIVIGGATDIALRVTKKHELILSVIDISAISELKQIEEDTTSITIGAGLPLTDLLPFVEKDFGALTEMLAVFGSHQIRNMATLGGNLGTGSPIGDTLPVLMAYNARVRLQSSTGKREVLLDEFIRGYRKTDCRPDELITAVVLPKPGKEVIVRSYKISKRRELDISTISAAFRIELADDGIVKQAKFCYGGMAECTKRAGTAENYVVGKSWSRETVEMAMGLMDRDFTPISDVRGSAEYRRVVARNLMLKFWAETSV